MKKKLLTFMCIGMMALSLVGCDKEDKEDKKETTEATVDFDLPDLNELEDTDESEETEEPASSEEPTTEETIADDGWVLVGSERTGYVQLPDEWSEHESEADGGEKYSLQYLAPAEDGLVSLIDSDYDFDENQYEVDDPADIVTQAYVEQYGSMGATNEGVDVAVMDGIGFYKTIDVLPAGTYTDYEYVLYTYVAYYDGRFYTVVVEGERNMVEEISKKVEATYSLTGEGDTVSSSNIDVDEELDMPQSEGKIDWETYYANVNGDEYTLPCDFSEFAANGWVLDESCIGETIEYEDYTYAFIDNGDKEFYIVVANNFSETPIAIDEGLVCGVVYDFHSEDMPGNIEGGICLGTPYDTVIEAFGTPDDIYIDDEDDYKQMTYFGETMSSDMYTKLEIIVEDGVVTKIEMKHWYQ
ncbi:MAG: hypothetical protein IJO70_02500 [Lachnospiraceae bacterium]|nr:hypothetical protein [Lachnospiraceae bacterium]